MRIIMEIRAIVLKMLRILLRKTGLETPLLHFIDPNDHGFFGLHPNNLIAVVKAMHEAPSGDYYEFGLFKGFCLWFATQVADVLGRQDMRFYGFDSFKGMPEPKGVDRSNTLGSSNRLRRGDCSVEAKYVYEKLKEFGSDMSRVTLTEGFFEDTLPDFASKHQVQSLRPASIVLIDCDFYASTKTVLEFLPNILQVGTIILFDDWKLYEQDKGQQMALKEWLEHSPGLFLTEYFDFNMGKGFKVSSLSNNK